MAQIQAVFEVKNRVTGAWVDIATASVSCVNVHAHPFDSVRFHLLNNYHGAAGGYGRTEDETAAAVSEIESTRARVLEIGQHLASQWRDGDSPSADLAAYGAKHGLTFTNRPRPSDRNEELWTGHDSAGHCPSDADTSSLDPQRYPESAGAPVPPIFDGFTNGEVERVLTLHTLVPALRTYYSPDEVEEMARQVVEGQTAGFNARFRVVNYARWFANANAMLHRIQSGAMSDTIGDVSDVLYPSGGDAADTVRDPNEPTVAMRDLLAEHNTRTFAGTVRMLQRLFCPDERQSSPETNPNLENLSSDEKTPTLSASSVPCRRGVRLNYVVVATIAEFVRTDVEDCRLGFRDDAGRTEHFLRCGKRAKPQTCVIM